MLLRGSRREQKPARDCRPPRAIRITVARRRDHQDLHRAVVPSFGTSTDTICDPLAIRFLACCTNARVVFPWFAQRRPRLLRLAADCLAF